MKVSRAGIYHVDQYRRKCWFAYKIDLCYLSGINKTLYNSLFDVEVMEHVGKNEGQA